MPRPHYILNAERVSVDKTTNQITAFSILEGLQITVRKLKVKGRGDVEKEAPRTVFSFVNVAVWEREDADVGQEFDAEVLFQAPGGNVESVRQSRIRFDSPYQRFVSRLTVGLPVEQSGYISLKCRLRAVGDREWIEQETLLPLSVVRESDE